MVRGQRVLVEPSRGNGPHQPMGVDSDSPILFVSVVHASAARVMLREERIEGWCGWSICMAPGACNTTADPPAPQTVGTTELTPGGGPAVPPERGWGPTAGVDPGEGRGPGPREETVPNPHNVGRKGAACQSGSQRLEVRDGTARLAAATGRLAEGCGDETTPKRQRSLTADEQGTTPAYSCARANSASEAYCQSCEMRLVRPRRSQPLQPPSGMLRSRPGSPGGV